MNELCLESMSAQMSDFYAEREALHNQLGVSSAEEILEMVDSLQQQLADLYADKEGHCDPKEVALTIREMDNEFHQAFPARQLTVERNGGPWKFSAVWSAR